MLRSSAVWPSEKVICIRMIKNKQRTSVKTRSCYVLYGRRCDRPEQALRRSLVVRRGAAA